MIISLLLIGSQNMSATTSTKLLLKCECIVLHYAACNQTWLTLTELANVDTHRCNRPIPPNCCHWVRVTSDKLLSIRHIQKGYGDGCHGMSRNRAFCSFGLTSHSCSTGESVTARFPYFPFPPVQYEVVFGWFILLESSCWSIHHCRICI